jgi:nucleotidyltransferase substrate binding protein (TIGR01987 family)
MERLNLKRVDAEKALVSLQEALREPFSILVRDASIQRFEYTFEAVWKYLKLYLEVQEGVVCQSPKACFKSAFSTGLLTEDETLTCLEMTDRRNDTSHTYKEAVAEAIYRQLPVFAVLMSALLEKSRR